MKSFLGGAIVLMALATTWSCSKEEDEKTTEVVQLNAPEISLNETGYNSASLIWDSVENAEYYNLYYSGDDNPEITIKNSIKLTGLEPATTYTVSVTAVPASQSKFKESKTSNSITFTTLDKPQLDTAEITVSNLTTTGVKIAWAVVNNAGSYIYKWADEDEVTTTETSIEKTGLPMDSAFVFKVKAVPTEDVSEDWAASPWATVEFRTLAPELSTPVISVMKATTLKATLGWTAIEDASYYEYALDSETAADTTATAITYIGLAADSEHTFKVRAVLKLDDGRLYYSDWAENTFTVKDYNSSTLSLSNAEATDKSVTFTATITSAETFYMGVLPKGNYLKADDATQIDSAAVLSKLISEISTDALKSATTTQTFTEGICHGTSYLCVGFAYDTEEQQVVSDIKIIETKTSAHVENPGNYNFSTDESIFSASTWLRYISFTNGTFLTDKDSFTLKYTKEGSENFTAVKYALYKLSNFEAAHGTEQEAIVTSLATYFETSGNSVAASGITSLNNGSYSSYFKSREEGTTYVLAVMATTESDKKVYACSTIDTNSDDYDWIHISGTSAGTFTITTDMPVASGKYVCTTIGTNRNTPALIETYIESNGKALTDARVEAINGTGLNINYGSLTAGTNYQFILQVTNLAGDTVTRNCQITAE
ncbi:MAG: fibronectin type III domain-containing protein [Bacteroidales bacterium]|nr:fibronectin type III domain-containing protein [Bacteroidales bacterium]